MDVRVFGLGCDICSCVSEAVLWMSCFSCMFGYVVLRRFLCSGFLQFLRLLVTFIWCFGFHILNYVMLTWIVIR